MKHFIQTGSAGGCPSRRLAFTLVEMAVALVILSIVCLGALNFIASPMPAEHLRRSAAIETAEGILSWMFAAEFEPAAPSNTVFEPGAYWFDGDRVLKRESASSEPSLLPIASQPNTAGIHYRLSVSNAVLEESGPTVRIAAIEMFDNRKTWSSGHPFATFSLVLPP